jgi:plasmid stabilization system protein ParE
VTRDVRFHPLATAEVVEAQLWYEDRVDGLGDRFLASLRMATNRAARWPNTGAPVRVDAAGSVLERTVGMRGFPYIVVYRVRDEEVDVLAVHHERRRPMYWADRGEGP